MRGLDTAAPNGAFTVLRLGPRTVKAQPAWRPSGPHRGEETEILAIDADQIEAVRRARGSLTWRTLPRACFRHRAYQVLTVR